MALIFISKICLVERGSFINTSMILTNNSDKEDMKIWICYKNLRYNYYIII